MTFHTPRARWLSKRLPSFGEHRRLVVLTGARQTGKTTLAREHYSNLRYLNLDNLETRTALDQLRTAAWATTVGNAVVDEAQKAPSVFEKVKFAFDGHEIDFTVLLGSSRILLLRQIRETLAGRAFLYDLWPLMLSELLTPVGATLPRPLFDHLLTDSPNEVLAEQSPVLLGEEEEERRRAVDFLGTWGGMPALVGLDDEDRRMWLRSYQQTFLERDLVDLVRLSDLQPFRVLQRLAMLRSGQLLSYSEIARDAQISSSTAKRYIEYLRISYQVALLQPYLRNLTSRTIKTPKIYWLDLGLLRQGTGQRGALAGALFETLVIGECQKWISTMARDAELCFYRTRSGLEVDLLVETPGGVLAIEIKGRDRAHSSDMRGLKTLRGALGDEWRGGLVVTRGRDIRLLDESHDIWEVPLHRLF
ncbi:MAG: ATP-binding protein [Acidobacteriota bacterium]